MPHPLPPPLSSADRSNFETLRQAHDDGNLCLVSAIRKFYPVPLAVMVEDNPFDLFEDPMMEA